ncbi:MAG: inositol phosphorylceramide synthase [Bacteriovoracaceae bacterium]|nr:inositol phosphorylceramide synthase [Bacteriovoracaceae bacterium]
MIRIFVTTENRIPYLLAIGTVLMGLYSLTNQFPIFEPQYLPLTFIDKAIPYIPWSSWIYITLHLYDISIIFKLKSSRNLTRFAIAGMASSIISTLFFVFLPTTYPRVSLDPINPDLGMVWIQKMDTPINCFPSMHIASVAFSFMFYQLERKGVSKVYSVWGLLICLSTITTRQHYFVDAIGGLVLALFCFWISGVLVEKEPLELNNVEAV